MQIEQNQIFFLLYQAMILGQISSQRCYLLLDMYSWTAYSLFAEDAAGEAPLSWGNMLPVEGRLPSPPDDAMMNRLAEAAASQAIGTFAVTFTKRLPSRLWEVLEDEVAIMSWGSATVYIQQKIA